MNSEDVKKIYGSPKKKKGKIKLLRKNREEDVNNIFKVIKENPDIYVTELIKISGRCSEIVNRCLKELFKQGRITKTKWFCDGIPHRVYLNVKK